MRQITFACQPSFEKHARPSRREQFLQTMESVVPWSDLEALIEPYYPKAGNGRQPVGLSIMLRIYFLQHWFSLSDPGAKAHIGVDSKESIVHSVCTSAASVHDKHMLPDLLHGADENEKRKNRTKSRVRAKVEWPFRILKRVFKFTKVRYRGIKKNHEWLLTAFALVNLYQHRKRLIPQLASLGA